MSTSASSDWLPCAMPETLRLRAALNALIRQHFANTGALEVETPILSQAGNTDPNIKSFSLQFSGSVTAGSRERWLRTSPEFAMKRLLAAGVGDCYELGRVFRDGEAGGRHNPEFSMLEWYRVGWDHHRLMEEVATLISAALALVNRSICARRSTYRQLFVDALAIDPFTVDEASLRAPLDAFRIDPSGLTRDDWLDLLMTHLIQPTFTPDSLLLLSDYPASQCALARIRGSGADALAERFEVFLGPLELANGYHELLDADEQRQRFERDIETRAARGEPSPPIDERLLAAMHQGLPACAGVALGVDRLLLAMLGVDQIQHALTFPFTNA